MALPILADDLSRPYNLVFRNTFENARIREMVEKHRSTSLRFLNIWGAKFDKDRVDYHLGHIYVLQKLRDIVQQTDVKSHLYIGINLSREFINREREQRQAAYIRCTEHLLNRIVVPSKGNRVTVHNCGDVDTFNVELQRYADMSVRYGRS